MLNLFEDDDGVETDLKVNKAFAEKYEHNARRAEMDRLGDKYEDDDESGEEEDSGGALLTEKADKKYNELL